MANNLRRGFRDLADGAAVPYLSTGTGPVSLVYLPGASDGLMTVYQGSIHFAAFFKKRNKLCSMLLLSRRQPLDRVLEPEEHADDMIPAIEAWGRGPVILEASSAGGPVAQQIALKRPDLVKALILTSTLHKAGAELLRILDHWISLTELENWKELNWSAIEYSVRPEKLKYYKILKPLLGIRKPSMGPGRFANILKGLKKFDHTSILGRMTQPTLVIGGKDDRLLGDSVQQEMASLIPGAELKLFPGYGHGNEGENPDYLPAVIDFIDRHH